MSGMLRLKLFVLNEDQTETKESKWDMPDELLLLLETVEKTAPTNALVYVPWSDHVYHVADVAL